MAEAAEIPPTFGTFVKDGHDIRVAHTVGEAVLLRFDGWAEKPVEEIKGAELDAALVADGQPTTGSADEKRARLASSLTKS